MKGMIRFVVGLVVVMGAVGGMDTATDMQLIPLLGIALLGLASMASGANANKKENGYVL